jgi:choline kinase
MQAIILAAGMGKRLGSLTENNTKCRIEVNGITLIDRLLSQLSILNPNKIIIGIGYDGIMMCKY